MEERSKCISVDLGQNQPSMENSRQALQRTVDLLINSANSREENITVAEIAGRIGITEKQLQAYLHGEVETPAGLDLKLKSAYDITTTLIMSIEEKVAPESPAPGSESPETNRSSLANIIFMIKKLGEAKGMNITEEEMAGKTGISGEQMQAYLDGRDEVPGNLHNLLWTAYTDLITAQHIESSRESLQHTVVFIRNHGLARRINITVEDMAREIGISGEQLFIALRDGYNVMSGDLSLQLRAAYKKLLKGVEQVELKEDLNMIIASERL